MPEINASQPRVNPETPAPTTPSAPQASPSDDNKKKTEEAAKNQQAQQVETVEQAKVEQPQKVDQPASMSFEFMTAFSTVVHEGYENYRTPQSDASSGAYGDSRGQENQRDLQVLREFSREASRMLSDQKIEVSQMIHRMKVEQGGVFWNRLQQVLNKGIPVHQAVLFQKLDKDAGDIKHKFGSPEIPVLGDKAGEAGKAVRNPAGQALSELLKAESNPTTQIEHMVLALQIMHREGMKDSSQKLMNYLRNRWGMSEDELKRFLADHNLPYYLGPMPRKDREEEGRATFFYPLLALVVIPIGMIAGMDFLWSAVLAVALAGFSLIFTSQGKK